MNDNIATAPTTMIYGSFPERLIVLGQIGPTEI